LPQKRRFYRAGSRVGLSFYGETRDRVAALMNSPNYSPLLGVPSFSRFFRRATNKTFRGFLNEVRIGHASQRLLETDRTVAEVCYESGFGNLANFNRQFLKLRKVSPSDFRRKISIRT
jgi:methylphosphotriester-DNA--protein-cysteine methyltransferase